ncbi:uncharacterized protein UTRI_04209_B [Ustilago trichophora]|uniref:F-box domain-containing protein n=1 Tax=Ustilago trichophora TaxID=86804 RepID=A0A5C3EAV4_9BASI|nr:uncharacterized protein UTRI_04209_B [Ustilago trichophora]
MASLPSDDYPYHHFSDDEQLFTVELITGPDSPDFDTVEEELSRELEATTHAAFDLEEHPPTDALSDSDLEDWYIEIDRLEHKALALQERLEDLAERRGEASLLFRAEEEMVKAMNVKVKLEKADEEDNELALVPITITDPRPTTLREAWSRNDHETAIRLASGLIECLSNAPALYDLDGVQQLCAALRFRFKAYESLGLNALAVADANRLLGLLAEFGDVDVEVDQNLLPLLEPFASTSISSPERRSARLEALKGPKRPSEDQLGGQLVKRKKGGHRRLVRKSARIIQLPVELIVEIADYLPTVDRISLANTRHEWRGIPQLWQSLEFIRIKNTNRKGWHRDTIDACIFAIETCQRRSHGSLSRVVLKGFLTSRTVGPILNALRPSSATLKYIAIPTLDQGQCFEQLYQRCPNLQGIDIRVHTDTKEVHPIQDEHLSRATSLFSSSKLPFKLKTLISTQDIDCGDIAPHMEGLEIARGLKYTRQKQLNFIEGIVRAAPSLIEWRDDPDNKWDSTIVMLGDYGVGQEQLPKEPIVFPKLRKLAGIWSEHFIDCEFPALTEARLNSLRGPSSLSPVQQNDTLRIATVITKSPSLKKLDILLPSGNQALKQIFSAIGTLEHLEDLGLWSSGTLSLQALLEVQSQSERSAEDTCPKVICPGLHTLRLHSRVVSVRFERELERELSEFLLLRFYLKRGCTLKHAKDRTHAALIAYEKAGYGMNKTQKKKLVASSAAEAAKSSYQGTFVTVDNNRRETFDTVLSKLLLSRNMKQNLLEGNQSLLNQLILQTGEIDTSKFFEALGGRYY